MKILITSKGKTKEYQCDWFGYELRDGSFLFKEKGKTSLRTSVESDYERIMIEKEVK
jgi:hypothetical protein